MFKKLELTFRQSLREPRERSRERENVGTKEEKLEETELVKNDHYNDDHDEAETL